MIIGNIIAFRGGIAKRNRGGAAGEKAESMVRYIRYSDKAHVVDEATAELDTIVREARTNKEVSMVYLRALEHEEALKSEGREEGAREKEAYYKPILEQKNAEIADKDARIAQLESQLAALK